MGEEPVLVHLRPDALESPPSRRRGLRLPAAALVLMIALIGAAFAVVKPVDEKAASAERPGPAFERNADGDVLIPNAATDGVLTVTIPPGTGEAMALGRNGYVMPSVIRLKVGDKVVIHNEDAFPHVMMFAFVMPGETVERTFDTVGSETYSAGCTIDPSPNGFTSLFVSE